MPKHSQARKGDLPRAPDSMDHQAPGKSVWSALSPAQFDFLHKHQIVRSHAQAEVLFDVGTHCVGLMTVTEGTVLSERQGSANQARRLHLIEPGEILGWADMFSGGIHHTRAICMTDVKVTVVPANLVQDLVKCQPLLGLGLLSHAAREMERTEQGALEQIQDSARRRLARTLAALKDQHGQARDTGEIDIALPMSRRDLADLIAVRPETLSRLIRELETDAVASFGLRNVRIPDLDVLLDEIEDDEDSLPQVPVLAHFGKVHAAQARKDRMRAS